MTLLIIASLPILTWGACEPELVVAVTEALWCGCSVAEGELCSNWVPIHPSVGDSVSHAPESERQKQARLYGTRRPTTSTTSAGSPPPEN